MRAVFQPGIKENAGISTIPGLGRNGRMHAWQRDQAYEYYRASMPAVITNGPQLRPERTLHVQGQTTYSTYSRAPVTPALPG